MTGDREDFLLERINEKKTELNKLIVASSYDLTARSVQECSESLERLLSVLYRLRGMHWSSIENDKHRCPAHTNHR